MKIDQDILTKAASALCRDMGGLGDLPSELRNTIASLYYEYLWFQTTKDPSSGHEDWTKRVVTRMGHYEMVPTLVKQMREVRRDNNLAFEMMVGTTSDLLKYNLRDVVRKSAARRAIEKAFRIPHYEVPGIYNRMELAFTAGETRRSSEIDESEGDTNSTISNQGGMEDPALNFIGELPHSDHNKPENVLRSRDLLITYYRNPTTIGEIEANISPPYKYPQVAVVEIDHNPRLIVRTEESLFGEIFLCSLSRNGSHSNFGSFPHSDSSKFLRKAFEKASELLDRKEASSAAHSGRTIIKCPSCNRALRVPTGKSGKVRCNGCGILFEART